MKAKIYFLLTVVFFSCNHKKTLTPVEMVQWAESEESELFHQKELNGVRYRLQYLPADYLVLRELGLQEKIDAKKYMSRKKELEKYHHFSLRLSVPGEKTDPLTYAISGPEEYNQRDMFYGFMFKDHIKMVGVNQSKNDTSNCTLYHFVQSHGLAPYADMVFAFEKKKEKQDLQVIFDDPVFNNGLMKYSFTSEQIDNLPQVKI